MRALNIGLVVGGLLLAASSADAQSSTQIKPRVLLMVDTSGSMTEHFTDTQTTGGDGSVIYSDAKMTRTLAANGNLGLYVGYELAPLTCPSMASTKFDGSNSRIYAAKQAVNNVISGSGDIDWGLMRYTGTQCAVVNTVTSNTTSCTTDNDCPVGQFCGIGTANKCATDNNLCFNYFFSAGGETAGYGSTRSVGGTCSNQSGANGNAVPYTGSCGTGVAAGNAACATPEVCYGDTDCNGAAAGSCVTLTGSSAKACKCGGAFTCPAAWTCGAGGFCVYNKGCENPGGTILVDPSTAGASNQVLPYVDGIEALPGNLAGLPTNPELRAAGGTPLAGAARSATAWYKTVSATDAQAACRPYVLVQMTDGFDSCDADTTNGPIAAAGSFVAATVPNAKNINKVYVIGLAFGGTSSPTLDAIAQAGGTGKARLANSQQDIEAALADIVSSSVLHEVCNDDDDNCNNLCDEDFPDVAVDNAKNPNCTPRAAKRCDNGQPGLCRAAGLFACSTDQLSEVCVAPTCTATPGATVAAGAGVGKEMRLNNVSGMVAGNVGKFIFVSGSTKVANDGGFLISGFNSATSIDVTNPGVVLPDSSSVAWAIPATQGRGTTAFSGGNVTITITTGSTNGLIAGQPIWVGAAGSPGNNGQFIITAVDTANNKITFANSAGVAADTVTWAVDICKGIESCNGLDDDCDGLVDNCGGGGAGSCCQTICPMCAKAPFIETCNNCDDDCDQVVDNHLVDTGLACGKNVGDCVGGVTMCCSADPNTSGSCTINGTSDAIYCKDANNGFPKGTNPGNYDLCDGTDDNCNGVPNDGPPAVCYTDGTNTLPMGKDGVGVCHHGLEACQTLPLCGTSGASSCIPGACPVGWPAGKVCPNPNPPTYGACQGLIAPSTEFCDGLDNDCNACTDDNPQDTWLNTQCCVDKAGNQLPLGDCDPTAAGTMCQRGTFQCYQPGGNCTPGAKTCRNAVAKATEVCNGIDDDCNGVVDDVPGVGAPCTGPGIFTAGACTAVMRCVTNGQPPQCVQVIGPTSEKCNGLDDDCDGVIDNPPFVPNPPDPTIGSPCDVPMPPLNNPPCKAGVWDCVAGKPQCDGAVGPMPNQCNGISTDCTGNPNTNGNCPTGFQCYQGNCVAPCQAGEFPCPGGYACNMNTTACDVNGTHAGCCVPDACAQITCPLGYNCTLDAQGNAKCVDPCVGVSCPPSYICKLGACVDGSCRTQGCPDGQICVDDPTSSMFVCQPDPCANVMCGSNQFCQAGVCVNSCAGPCPNGQYCDKGQCVPDPCAHTPCVEGQVCRVENGLGVCVENQCQFGCNIGQACCGGECVADQCENLHCPEDTHCTLTPDCQATCETNPASPKDQVVGAGGGGFGCAVAGHGTGEASSSLVWLLAVAGALLFRRRRAAEVRK